VKSRCAGTKIFLIAAITLLIASTSLPQSTPKSFDNNKIVEVNFMERRSSKPVNEICPVEGKKIDNELPYLIFDYKIYGFCCKSCIEVFNNNPKYYLNNSGKNSI
jgi:YHS domain-containing protein